MSDQTREQDEWVSALMDGELQDAEFVRTLDHLESSPDARDAWDTYHLVGEVLRSGQLANPVHDVEFVVRLRLQIADDGKAFTSEDHDIEALAAIKSMNKPVANDGLWRRVVGLASVAVVGVLVWQAQSWISADRLPVGGAVLAQSPVQRSVQGSSASVAAALVDDETPVMLRDPQLDALLAAHRQHGGVTALQMPAGFLRSATFSEGTR